MTLPEKRRTSAVLGRTIPALPVRDIGAAVAYHRKRFGFDVRHQAVDFAVLVRDDAVIHLWAASDEGWRAREPGGAADLLRRRIIPRGHGELPDRARSEGKRTCDEAVSVDETRCRGLV